MYPLRIMIVDDHPLIREGFEVLLRNQPLACLVGEAASGEELLRQIPQLQPDIIFMDIQLPTIDGIGATHLLKNQWPWIQVIAFTMQDEERFVRDMFCAGASGYLLKNTHKQEVMEAIAVVQSGGIFCCSHSQKKVLRLLEKKQLFLRAKKEEAGLLKKSANKGRPGNAGLNDVQAAIVERQLLSVNPSLLDDQQAIDYGLRQALLCLASR